MKIATIILMLILFQKPAYAYTNETLHETHGSGGTKQGPDGTRTHFGAEGSQSAIHMRNHASPSPDGSRIVYHARSEETKTSLYSASTDGTKEQLLWGTPDTIEQEPRWSKDGKWIAFVGGTSYKNGALQLHIVRPDGSGHQQLTSVRDGMVKGPSWSPDSKQILFEIRDREAGISTLHILDLASRQQRQITKTVDGMLVQAEWSPDGRSILVVERQASDQSDSDLWILQLDDTKQRRRLTSSAEGETMPVWAPNGMSIAFSRPMPGTGQHDLFLYSFHDDSEHRLTASADVSEYFPIFSKNGNSLFFDAVTQVNGTWRSSIEQIKLPPPY